MPPRRDLLAMLALAAIGALCIYAATGCTDLKQAGGEIGGSLAEVTICETPFVDCGHVYMCEAPSVNPLGHVEICVEDGASLADVEDVYGPCEHTPRHQGLCLWCCGSGCGRGANAYDGTWCP